MILRRRVCEAFEGENVNNEKLERRVRIDSSLNDDKVLFNELDR